MTNQKIKIAILSGGISSEREISLQTGACVAEALSAGGFNTVFADIAPDRLDILNDSSIDVFFIAIHGQFGEDGQIQQILEDRNLCYTGSGPAANKLAIDKIAAKKYFALAGVNAPKSIELTNETTIEQIKKYLSAEDDKYVVKPITHGSSVGVEIVNGPQFALETAKRCKSQFGDCMLEQFIAGKEITVGILNGKALPIIEIIPKEGFYDYHSKYIDDKTEYLFDTITDKNLIEKINNDAIACFNALNCRGTARVDFILADDRIPYALEINTVPGMTTHSCVPKAAAKIGLSMTDLCAEIFNYAIGDYEKRESAQLIQGIDGKKKKNNKKIITQEA